MRSERELRKRLASIRTTGKLASALKTTASAKFSRLNKLMAGYNEYSAKCADLLKHYGDGGISSEMDESGAVLYVLIAGNKGFCGGFNNMLFASFSPEKQSFCIACGKKAAEFCKNNRIDYEPFELDDTPKSEDAVRLLERISENCRGKRAVVLVYNKYVNVLTQKGVEEHFLPFAAAGGEAVLMLPSAEEIEKPLAKLCLGGRLYGVLLESALGAQAATMMTMRSAADSAADTAKTVETALNRERQRKLTAAVIESASGNAEF